MTNKLDETLSPTPCKTAVVFLVVNTDAPYIFPMSSTFGGKYSIEKELAIGGCGQ